MLTKENCTFKGKVMCIVHYTNRLENVNAEYSCKGGVRMDILRTMKSIQVIASCPLLTLCVKVRVVRYATVTDCVGYKAIDAFTVLNKGKAMSPYSQLHFGKLTLRSICCCLKVF